MLDFDLQGTAAVVTLVTGLITYIRTSQREKSIRRADLVRTYTSEFYSEEALVTLFTDLDYSRFRFTADEEIWLGKSPSKPSLGYSTCSTLWGTTGIGRYSALKTYTAPRSATRFSAPTMMRKCRNTWRMSMFGTPIISAQGLLSSTSVGLP